MFVILYLIVYVLIYITILFHIILCYIIYILYNTDKITHICISVLKICACIKFFFKK